MWLAYTIAHCFTMALVNYIDEYLTSNNKVNLEASIHKRIGGLILISTLFSSITIASLYIYLGDISIEAMPMYLALASAIPMVIMWCSYFYLFLLYPAHQVVPLFGLSSIWLVIMETASGSPVSLIALAGIGVLVWGAYLLDAGTFKWKIPTKLFLIMTGVSFMWASSLFLMRVASESADIVTLFFYQYIGIGLIGLVLLSLVKSYRDGLIYRLKTQGFNFVGFSLVNESLSQISFLFVMLAISLAPLAAYVTAMTGIQSIFVLMLFFFFPLHARNRITHIQWLAIVLIAIGIFIVEVWK